MDTTPRKVSLFLVFLVMFNILLNSMSAVWQSVRATDISNNSPATSAQQKIASKPNEPTFVSDGGKYTLSYILKNYNLFLQDDYQGTHVVGPVVVGGSFEKYLGGLTVGNKPNGYPHKVPSFIGGKVANNLTFNIYSDVPLYLGTVNQGNTYYINRAEYRSYFANNQIRYTDHYVDFSQWQKLKNEAIALNHTSNVHLSWDAKNKRVISSDETKCKITAGYNQKQMAKLQAGCSVTVDENVFPHIMFDVLGHSTTDDTIICSMGENIQLPDLLINGQYPKSIEDNKEGLAIVYALPNAKTVTRQGEVTGHIVAPDAKVDIHGGNYNGTIIAKSMHTNAEGHMWFYNGKKLAYATIELHVKKLWDDDSNRDGKRPKSIFVQLYGDQQKVGPVVKLDDTNNWTYTWKEFRKDLKGNVINYRVDEVSVPTDYSKTIQHDAAQHQWTITNHYTNLKNTIKGEKIWRDNNNEDGLRPKSIDVKLIAKVNGVEFPKYNQTQTVKPKDFANNKWSYEFKDLPVYDHGQKIDYSLKEINVNKHYTSQINGFNIINTHQVKKTAVYVKKVWQDENNLEQIRPNQIKVWLLKNGQRTKKFKVLNNQTNWEAEFVNLNMYEDGKLIQYSIEEEPVKDYQASVINTKKGFNLINTHQVEKTEIKGQKTWKDDNNRDGLRPISIKVKLIAKVKGKEISELSKTQEFKPINVRDNIWHYSFGELPTHYQGSKVKYSVKEIDVPQGYQVTEKGLDLINTHQVEKTEIKGQKTWNDNNNQDGLRPESITIRLYDGDGEVKHITVTAKDKWKYSFTNLPVNKNGKKIEYTIKEDKVQDYTTSIEGFNVTNTHKPAVTQVEGKKIWEDNNNQDGLRPTSIKVKLIAKVKGKEISELSQTQEIKPINVQDNIWHYSFGELPTHYQGSKVKYSVKEIDVPQGYQVTEKGLDLINTHQVEKTEIKGQKTWNDNNNQDGLRPESITIRLYDGDGEVKHVTVTAKDKWKYSFTNLPVNKNGKKIDYTIKEDKVQDYTTSIEGFNVTNTHKPAVTQVEGKKIWEDNNNQDGLRPTSIKVKLIAKVKGKEISELSKTQEFKSIKVQDNIWHYSFGELPTHYQGSKVKYSVQEIDVPQGYQVKEKGFNLINTHQVEKTEIKGQKTWNDNNNQDGLRPVSITIRLYDGDGEVKHVTVTAQDKWKYSFTNLPVKKNGKKIDYTIKEDKVTDYTTSIEGFNVTNTHKPGVTQVEGKKIWEDNNNQDGLRPTSIKVKLIAKVKGKEISELSKTQEFKPINVQDNIWHYSFGELPTHYQGSKVKYSVKEIDVPQGYQVTEKELNLINTHKPGVTQVEGKKIWEDNNNQDGLRPTSIKVKLIAKVKGKEISELSKTQEFKSINVQDNIWHYSFGELPTHYQGSKVKYSVQEIDVPQGYQVTEKGLDLINTHQVEKTEIKGQKTWEDDNNQDGLRPTSIKVKLIAKVKGKEISELSKTQEFKPIKVQNNIWHYSFGELPTHYQGSKVKYSVKEIDVPQGYQVTEKELNLINTHQVEKTEIKGQKTWEDNNNQDGLRPESITIRLYDGDGEVKHITVTAKDKWKYSFTNLPVNKNGKKIDYTISEDKVKDYTTSIEGFNVTNTHKPGITQVEGKKIWEDDNNRDGLRPTSIKVKLIAKVKGKEISELSKTKEFKPINVQDNIWHYSFGELPTHYQGSKVKYSVKEIDVPQGYQVTEQGLDLINTHQVKQPKKQKTLPSTGQKTTMSGLVGIVLMIISWGLGYRIRKKV